MHRKTLASHFLLRPGVVSLFDKCRPRILVLTDSLFFDPNHHFGLTRFLEAITSMVPKPLLTLAYRGNSSPPSVTINGDTYTIVQPFTFGPTITTSNYDQIWIFGFDSGPGMGGFTLSAAEVGVVSTFMNNGGGMFATGDHGTLGKALSSELPRIRHMREWTSIPMGGEPLPTALGRIDTIVNPGPGNLYEFDDQADDIPQRIYPNYTVTPASTAVGWEATVHRLLSVGPVQAHDTASEFVNDLDVLPDHAHESVCYETPAAALPGMYNAHGQNFAEYPPLAGTTQPFGAEIVAYAVSGGRAVQHPNGFWKPPVRPQMFGVISAYDGHAAQPYSGTLKPGRIVCDSTWHHFVNVNLDGTSTTRTGLGTGTGSSFVPGPDLQKIYQYYRNIVEWLQPANRVWCRWWPNLVALRFDAVLAEELAESFKFTTWGDYVALGRTIAARTGIADLEDIIASVLVADRRVEPVGELVARRNREPVAIDTRELTLGIAGGTLVKVAQMLPFGDEAKSIEVLKRGVEKNADELMKETVRLVTLGLDEKARRAERELAVVNDKRIRKLLK